MSNKCCSNPSVKLFDTSYICTNCSTESGDIIFDDYTIDKHFTKPNLDRFIKLTYDLPGQVQATLDDYVRILINNFLPSTRKNFFSMSTVIYYLLIKTGYGEYAPRFKKLKSQDKCNEIENFINSTFEDYFNGRSKKKPLRLEDFPLMTSETTPIVSAKCLSFPVYSDLKK